jgi:hypothetical protein
MSLPLRNIAHAPRPPHGQRSADIPRPPARRDGAGMYRLR